ncbi:DUF2807 domain-containing protein [Carboxylicivirga mesophila]|uniref:DUF2807 domain-containing protein n=1 Tax=Carboxylicivirga mesophila TaxID=1166478 RepID=A0ABS5K5I0_9BACT|nr:DUF2807 domain-containing protein [Carboxylicivirga mesophila]MBS2210225.1 DUF2807 domain-containing protein [Carboxylicivirga mesophila]
MRRLIYIALSLTTLLLFAACEYIHNLMDDGDITQQEQMIGPIHHIVADAPCRIVLHNNETNQVLIKGVNRLLDDLELSTNNGTLTIEHNKKNFLQKSKLIEIGISARHLNKITANMAIEIEAPETIKADQFAMIVNGGAKFAEISLNLDCQSVTLNVYGNNNIGNYYIGGNSANSSFTLEGSVNIDASELRSNTVKVIHKSIGSCKVFPVTSLQVYTYSSGNTYYKGQPAIEHERIKVSYLQNTGNVIKID